MPDVILEQALFHRDRDQIAILRVRSTGFVEAWTDPLAELLKNFGERPAGVACPLALFTQPLGKTHVALVRVKDSENGPTGWAGLWYHVLILPASDYAGLGGDPFVLADKVPATWSVQSLAAVALPAQLLNPRGIAHVRAVLQRVKSHALAENADPTTPPTLTEENAESPTLLGGTQILVDGGKLIFERTQPDASVLAALWTLLPHSLRPKLWAASFAFSIENGFDVLVVPRLNAVSLEGYITEEQAGDYPPGSYELALQTAVETGAESDLESVLNRRTSNETLSLTWKLLVGISLLVLVMRFAFPQQDPPADPVPRAAAVAGIVGAQDPWTALPLIELGNRLFRK